MKALVILGLVGLGLYLIAKAWKPIMLVVLVLMVTR